jgi:hypothetical protein
VTATLLKCGSGGLVPQAGLAFNAGNWKLPRKSGLVTATTIARRVHAMTDVRTIKERKRHGGAPLVVAAAIAALGVLGMLIVDHGPWAKPTVQPAATANHSTTGEAARAAGAKVMPTEPRGPIEPVPPGPKPVQPANPSPPQ